MKEQSYFTFRLNNSIYGIITNYVEEVFPLPELTVVSSKNQDLVGVLNLRGEMLPVMNLNLILGMPSPDYQVTDSILVLRWEYSRVGIIVNEVYEERKLFPDQITTELSNHQDVGEKDGNKIIADLLRRAGDILILNNPETWIKPVDIEPILSEIQDRYPGDTFQLLNQQSIFCLNATPEEQIIFRERADNLKAAVNSQELQDLKPIAVIVLNGNLFGVDLAMVREFTDISRITPIPCCPKHIIGNMNLRGEILTLIDLRVFLHLPMNAILEGYKVMVVDFEGIVVGVIVAEVSEAMLFIEPSEIISTGIHGINNQYIQGVASYQEKTISILDLPKMFLNGSLIVDEVV